jgi:pyruvate/2-oxoacid:ferredoxin oxidoreductase alpha subunit
MLRQVEGSKAVADAVAACAPEVICAYPISPQTHIVEGLGQLVKDGSLPHCEFINVESEFARVVPAHIPPPQAKVSSTWLKRSTTHLAWDFLS